MKHYLVPALAALALSMGPAWAQTTQTQQDITVKTEAMAKVTTAAEFVPKAAMTDMFEIQAGKLAGQQGGSDAVKTMGQQLVEDHTKSSEQLKKIIKDGDLQVKPPPKQLDDEHQQMLDQLKQAKGADFDRLFAQMNDQGHQQAIAMFTAYSQNGDNPDLKNFAAETLPVLQKHEDMAKKIETKQSS